MPPFSLTKEMISGVFNLADINKDGEVSESELYEAASFVSKTDFEELIEQWANEAIDDNDEVGYEQLSSILVATDLSDKDQLAV